MDTWDIMGNPKHCKTLKLDSKKIVKKVGYKWIHGTSYMYLGNPKHCTT